MVAPHQDNKDASRLPVLNLSSNILVDIGSTHAARKVSIVLEELVETHARRDSSRELPLRSRIHEPFVFNSYERA